MVSSYANRGNVAVICWNTLNAATWYVDSEKLDGEVALGQDSKTLLAINFSDFTVEEKYADNNYKTGALKETDDDVVVVSTPARNAEIGDRQIVLGLSRDKFSEEYESFNFEKNPKKATKETKTYRNGDNVVAYVPEEVYSDLDSLKGNKVTVVFGEDNIVALIVVEDDVVDTAYLTKYEDNKVVVDGTSYKLASSYEVTLNEKSYNNLTLALTALKIADVTDIEKNIETTLTLDEDDKVEKIELFASANIDGVSFEGIVTKVKETSSKYTIYTTAGNITWEIDDEDDIDFPRVYIDGTKSDIRDIEVGNVLTVIGSKLDIANEKITTIYASTQTVTGEATKVKKANNAITIDGEIYPSSVVAEKVKNMTKDELKDDKWIEFDSTTVLDNKEVTLYMNVLGEYVGVAIEEDTSSYTFGVVTYVSTTTSWEGDDEEIAVKNIKVMLEDGTKKTFKVKVDTDDDDAPSEEVLDNLKEVSKNYTDIYNKIYNEFIMFKADADNTIQLEDGNEIIIVDGATLSAVVDAKSTTDATDDYDFAVIKPNTEVDGKEFKLTAGGTATYTSKTVIFNKEAGDEEIVSKWDSIIDSDDYVTGSAYAIFDADDDEALYIIVSLADYESSDAEYAIVDSKLVEVSDKKFEIDFVDQPDVQVKDESTVKAELNNIVGWFIKYTMASNKVDSAKKLIDLDEFKDLDADDIVEVGTVIKDPNESKYELAATLLTSVYSKANLEVEEISIDKDYAAIKYVDDVECGANVFENGTFYTMEETTWAAGVYEYNAENEEYVVTSDGSAVDAKKYYKFTEAPEYDADEAYFEKSGAVYTLADLSVDTTLGKIRLDDDNLVVIDLRDGKVVKTTLEDMAEETNIYAVLYKNEDCDPNREANVVIILGD